MRRKRQTQRTFQEFKTKWNNAEELAQIDKILSEHPQLCELVAQDLSAASKSNAGATGMTAEQVLRVAIIKQYQQLTYRQLEDRIDDSERLRCFCRFGDARIPRFNTLRDNLARIAAQTWEQLNEVLIQYAVEAKIETGRKVRVDTTGVETNIHYPTDARLIWDCVRVCIALTTGCVEWFGEKVGTYRNRTRGVKKRVFRIANTKSTEKRDKIYRELLKIATEVKEEAELLRARLVTLKGLDFDQQCVADVFRKDLDDVLIYFPQVLDQCRRRIVDGESVPAEEKVVSIFEPHSDIIVKGQRDPLFGHKICLTGGSSNLIISCQIEKGNPSDTDLYIPALARTSATMGKVPPQVVTDDGFASEANAEVARAMGVKDVVFGGKLKNELTRWVSSAWLQKQLRRFRAGIESMISAGKRCFGLDRCTWSGWEGFQSYVRLSIVAWNLQVLARHLLD